MKIFEKICCCVTAVIKLLQPNTQYQYDM